MAKTFAPEEMRARVDRLRREGRMPSVEQFMAAMENACAELASNTQDQEFLRQVGAAVDKPVQLSFKFDSTATVPKQERRFH